MEDLPDSPDLWDDLGCGRVLRRKELYNNDAVVVCVDIERYVQWPNQITEIGVATLDTRDVKTTDLKTLNEEFTDCGEYGENWFPKIKARHFRVQEYYQLDNRDDTFAAQPEKFLFGKSEWISEDSVHKTLMSAYTVPNVLATAPKGQKVIANRNIIEVGQDIEADDSYMEEIGWEAPTNVNFLQVADTQKMGHKRTLRVLLEAMGLQHNDCLHNGGNDAVFTLQLYIAELALDPEEFSAFRKRAEERTPTLNVRPRTWRRVPKQVKAPPFPLPRYNLRSGVRKERKVTAGFVNWDTGRSF